MEALQTADVKGNIDYQEYLDSCAHNLKNVGARTPRHRLLGIFDFSDGGKSNRAFDTIYAETSSKKTKKSLKEAHLRMVEIRGAGQKFLRPVSGSTVRSGGLLSYEF